jgi:hypothetical protein
MIRDAFNISILLMGFYYSATICSHFPGSFTILQLDLEARTLQLYSSFLRYLHWHPTLKLVFLTNNQSKYLHVLPFKFRMKVDLKLITILLSVVVLHVIFTEGWGVRIPNPVRVVRRVVRKTGKVIRTAVRKTGAGIRIAVRKTGEGIKTGIRKTGQGIKTGVRKTGEGLKKAGEGLKKAGQVTGKHLYKGLRETGKAFITASSVVSDILDRVSII